MSEQPEETTPKRDRGIGSIAHFFLTQQNAGQPGERPVRRPPGGEENPSPHDFASPADENRVEDPPAETERPTDEKPPFTIVDLSSPDKDKPEIPADALMAEALLADHLPNYMDKIEAYLYFLANLEERLGLVSIDQCDAKLYSDLNTTAGGENASREFSCFAETEDIAGSLIPALRELNEQYDILMVHHEQSFRPAAKPVINKCTWLTVLCTPDDDDLIQTYKTIKWIVEEIGWKHKIALFMCDVTGEAEAETIYRRLAKTVTEFLHADIELSGFIEKNDSFSHTPEDEATPSETHSETPTKSRIAEELEKQQAELASDMEPEDIDPDKDPRLIRIKNVDLPLYKPVKYKPQSESEEVPAADAEPQPVEESPVVEDTAQPVVDEPVQTVNEQPVQEQVAMNTVQTPQPTMQSRPVEQEQSSHINVFSPMPVGQLPRTDVQLSNELQLALPYWLTAVPSPMIMPVRLPETIDPSIRLVIDSNGGVYVLGTTLTANDGLLTEALKAKEWLETNYDMVLASCRQLFVDRTKPLGLILVAGGAVDSLRTHCRNLPDTPSHLMQLHLLQNGKNWSLLVMPA